MDRGQIRNLIWFQWVVLWIGIIACVAATAGFAVSGNIAAAVGFGLAALIQATGGAVGLGIASLVCDIHNWTEGLRADQLEQQNRTPRTMPRSRRPVGIDAEEE